MCSSRLVLLFSLWLKIYNYLAMEFSWYHQRDAYDSLLTQWKYYICLPLFYWCCNHSHVPFHVQLEDGMWCSVFGWCFVELFLCFTSLTLFFNIAHFCFGVSISFTLLILNLAQSLCISKSMVILFRLWSTSCRHHTFFFYRIYLSPTMNIKYSYIIYRKHIVNNSQEVLPFTLHCPNRDVLEFLYRPESRGGVFTKDTLMLKLKVCIR